MTASSIGSLPVNERLRDAMILAGGMERLLAKLPRVARLRSHDR